MWLKVSKIRILDNARNLSFVSCMKNLIVDSIQEANRNAKNWVAESFAKKTDTSIKPVPTIYKLIYGPTADEIVKDIDLSEKTCLITGATGGIGREIARSLNSRGCNVLMACRNIYEAGIVAKNYCMKSDCVKAYEMNLASLKSVQKCSKDILNEQSKIDMVILNAGIFGLPWTLTDDGLEITFQVNYLSQFYLLMNLEHILAQDARVVFVTSESHRRVKWPVQETLMPKEELLSLPREKYTPIQAFNVSKLCGVVAMYYLGYRWLGTGRGVFCAHPGTFIKTGLCRNWWPYEALYTAMTPFSKTVSQAAATPVYCATSPSLKGLSTFYMKDQKRIDPSDLAMDTRLSFRLYYLTMEMIKDRISMLDDNITEKTEAGHIKEEEHEGVERSLISEIY